MAIILLFENFTENHQKKFFWFFILQGDLNLGGLDFTQEIVNIIKKKPNCDTAAIDPAARFKQAEQIKIALSTQAVVDYEIDEKCSGTISQAEYHKTVKKYEKRILELAAKAVETANLKKSEITNVLVTGGSARSKFLYDALKLAYQMEPIVSDQPDTAIAEGAAIIAALLCGHSDAEKVLISQSVFGYAVKSIQGTQVIFFNLVQNLLRIFCVSRSFWYFSIA